MPVSKPCFGVGFKEEPLAGDLRTEALYDLILSRITGGMSPLYRRHSDEALVNPGPAGGAGGRLLLYPVHRKERRRHREAAAAGRDRPRPCRGVDREIFTLCKNVKNTVN